MLGDLGRPPLTLERVAGFVGNGVRHWSRGARCDRRPRRTISIARLARFRKPTARVPRRSWTRPYAGGEPTLERLAASGAALGICTNKPPEFAVTILKELGLCACRRPRGGKARCRSSNPTPAPLLHCLDRLGADETSALYVGDSEIDAETAFRAKVPFALFSGGYLRESVDAFEPVYVFDHFDDLSIITCCRGSADDEDRCLHFRR